MTETAKYTKTFLLITACALLLFQYLSAHAQINAKFLDPDFISAHPEEAYQELKKLKNQFAYYQRLSPSKKEKWKNSVSPAYEPAKIHVDEAVIEGLHDVIEAAVLRQELSWDVGFEAFMALTHATPHDPWLESTSQNILKDAKLPPVFDLIPHEQIIAAVINELLKTNNAWYLRTVHDAESAEFWRNRLPEDAKLGSEYSGFSDTPFEGETKRVLLRLRSLVPRQLAIMRPFEALPYLKKIKGRPNENPAYIA